MNGPHQLLAVRDLTYWVMVVVLGVLFFSWSTWRDRLRNRRFSAIARRRKMAYSPHDWDCLRDDLVLESDSNEDQVGDDRNHDGRDQNLPRAADFAAFRGGGEFANTMLGVHEVCGAAVQLLIGRFVPTLRTGRLDRRRRFTYIIVGNPFGQTPSLHLRPERWTDKLAAMIGFDDIDSQARQFSDAFHVSCADRAFALDLPCQDLTDFLITSEPPVIELADNRCCIFDPGVVWNDGQIEARLAWITQFFEHWPERLRAKLPTP